MTEKKKSAADAAASFALFSVILVASVVLALTTDLHVVARGGIAVAGGIAAAAVTYILVKRRART